MHFFKCYAMNSCERTQSKERWGSARLHPETSILQSWYLSPGIGKLSALWLLDLSSASVLFLSILISRFCLLCPSIKAGVPQDSVIPLFLHHCICSPKAHSFSGPKNVSVVDDTCTCSWSLSVPTGSTEPDGKSMSPPSLHTTCDLKLSEWHHQPPCLLNLETWIHLSLLLSYT